MGSKRRRHQAKVALASGLTVENDGMSLSGPVADILPPDMDPADIPDMIEDMGGVMEQCRRCEGFVAYGMTEGPGVGITWHFGPQDCPERFTVRRLPVQ